MIAETLVRYVHFMGILVFASLLVAEHVLLKSQLAKNDMRRLAIIDMAYGISALVVLAAGSALWFWVGKPSGFYTANPVFHAKLTAFVLMGLFSITPTRFILRNRKTSEDFIQVPKHIIHLVRAELALLILIPLLAVFMARGYGLAS